MAAKEKHIELSEKQRAILNEAATKINQLQHNYQIAQNMLNQQANANEALLKIICEAKETEHVQGIQFDGQKLIIPAPKK